MIDKALVFLPVDIVFPIGWQVIVDDQGHLLDINTSGLWRNIMVSYIFSLEYKNYICNNTVELPELIDFL